MTTIYLVVEVHECEGSTVLGAASTKEKAEQLTKLYAGADIIETEELVLDDEVDRKARGEKIYRVEFASRVSREVLSVVQMVDHRSTGACCRTDGCIIIDCWASSIADAMSKADPIYADFVTA